MDGMILAAGLGTRLLPLTARTPKALVPVAGMPMLERIARRMVAAGVDRLIINVHHHADQVRTFVSERDGFGVDVRISEETDAPLETGGGVLHARPHFREDGPFLVHNVDVITEADLAALHAAHLATGGVATLAVSDRPSSRLLRFDAMGLQGHVDVGSGDVEAARPPRGDTRDRAFAGIHVIDPGWFDLVEGTGAFPIIPAYLRLSAAGHRIGAHDIGSSLWLEVGDPDRLARARSLLRRGNGGGDDEAAPDA